MDVRRLESLLLQEHVVKKGQEHECHSYDSAFVSAVLLDTVIFDPEIRVVLVLDGSKGNWTSRGFK